MKYKVVAYDHQRCEIIVDAQSKEDAIDKVELGAYTTDEMTIDNDYCDFEIVSAELYNDPVLEKFVETLPNEEKKIERSISNFTYDLYQKLDKGQNILFSGYSVLSALSLAYLGVRGKTKENMFGSLGFTLDAPQTVNLLLKFGENINGDKVNTLIGNAIWFQKYFNLEQLFQKSPELKRLLIDPKLTDLIYTVDFENYPEYERRKINKWISQRTHNNINDLLPQGSINELTKIILTNAIYFKGIWGQEFDPECTIDGRFKNLDDSTSEVKFMYNGKTICGFYDDGESQVISLPYGDTYEPSASMIVILPRPGNFNSVDKKISSEYISKVVKNLDQEDNVRVWLPKFNLRYKKELVKVLVDDLKVFGSDLPDFSGFLGEDLFVSNILHEATIDVDEKGTEASGATSITLKRGMDSSPVFYANHPFIFIICDRNSVPVFMGRVVKM